MRFRFTAFGLHLAASACVLALVLCGFYLGWYRWPAWYLTRVVTVVAILIGVHLALGPLLTLLVADPRKPRHELARDIAVIIAVQLAALGYGTTTLWLGRPLYYTFSEDRLEIVQASAITPSEIALARTQNPAFAPHWFSRPRWVFAPLPEDLETRKAIVASAILEGQDVTEMPRYFRPWEQGLPALRTQLKAVDQFTIFTKAERTRLGERLTALGYDKNRPITLFMMGHDRPLLAVFDPATLELKALLRPD